MSGRAGKPRAHCALNLKGFKTDYTQSPELLLFIAALGAHALFVQGYAAERAASILLCVLNSVEAAFTPLVKVIFAIFGLSLSRSHTIFTMPSTVIVSLVTTSGICKRKFRGYKKGKPNGLPFKNFTLLY